MAQPLNTTLQQHIQRQVEDAAKQRQQDRAFMATQSAQPSPSTVAPAKQSPQLTVQPLACCGEHVSLLRVDTTQYLRLDTWATGVVVAGGLCLGVMLFFVFKTLKMLRWHRTT
jgi:hypothetical protein